MSHLLAPQADQDLDDIWLFVAKASASFEIADRLIDSITERFWMLARNPRVGRRRDHDLREGLRSFPVGEYVVIYRVAEDDIVILRVVRGSRDIGALLAGT